MIEETGMVISVQGDMAEVQGERRGACGGCAVKGACGTSLIARYLGRKRIVLRAQNAVGARPGDLVILGLPEDALLKASFVAYLVPLVSMIAGGVIGDHVGGLLTPAHAQAWSVLGGGGALAAALWWLGKFSRAKSADDRYRPRILRRAAETRQEVRFSSRALTRDHFRDGA